MKTKTIELIFDFVSPKFMTSSQEVRTLARPRST